MQWIDRNVGRAKQVFLDPMASGPGLAFGRYAFGNNAGLKQNVYGGLELWKSRRAGPFRNLVGTDATARAVDEVGYAKAPWCFSHELVERLAERFETAVKEQSVNQQKNERGELLVDSLRDPLRQAPEIQSLMNEQLCKVVYAYFGSHARIYTPDYWRIFHVEENDLASHERFSERWHNDSGKVSILSLLILMTDVDEAHGATWCITRDTTREIFRRNLDYREHDGAVSQLVENKTQSIRFTGKRGEAWFINTRRTLHRAGVPQRGLHRDILGLKFAPIAGDADVWDPAPCPEEKSLRWQKY